MVTRSYLGVGGHDTVINNLSIGLVKLGYDVTVGSFSFLQNPPADINKLKISKFCNISSHDETNYEIIHNHQTLMNYFSLRTSTPFVFHYHGVSSKLQEINLHTSLLICKKKISKIISVSNYATTHFSKYANAIPTQVIYNGVDTQFFNPSLSRIHTKGDPQLLFVGNLYRHKNAEVLIDMMEQILQRFPNAHLQIVGVGDSYESLVKKVQRKGLGEHVELVGKLDKDELKFRYSSCDIYISASSLEAYPVPPMEAMACGKPLLLSNIPAHMEILKESKAGLSFSLDDIPSVLNKIQQINDNKNIFSHAAREFAEKHDWQVVCKNISEIYQDLLYKKK